MEKVSEDLDESKNGREEELQIEDEDYNPNRPNVLGLLQSTVPAGFTLQQHGQSEVITGPDGRRFIAQLYEQAPAEVSNVIDASQSDESESTSSSDTSSSESEEETPAASQNLQGQDDGDMARTLCVNLLSELVKGSYQLFKTRGNQLHGPFKKEAVNKLNCIENKCKDLKESLLPNEGPDSTSSNISEKKQNFSDKIHPYSSPDMAKQKFSSENKLQENPREYDENNTHSNRIETAQNCDDWRKRKFKESAEECSSQTSFKKAKYSWQIKGTNSSLKENSETSDADKSAVSSTSVLNKEIEVSSETVKSTIDKVSQSKMDSSKNQHKITEETDIDKSGKKSSAENNPDDSQNINPASSESRSGEGQAPFSYLERWQNHHIAKAIVDNAINKTLDEMNLGPQDGSQVQSGSSFSRQRQRIEDAGVSQVILQRGLRRQTQPTSDTSTGGTTINPFINHLTEMTENMFVENLSQGLRFSARIDMAGNVQFNTRSIHESGNIMSDNISAAGVNNNSTVTRQISAAAISLTRRTSDSSTVEQVNDSTRTRVDNSNSFHDVNRLNNETKGNNKNASSPSMIDNVMCSESLSTLCTSSHFSTKSEHNENAHFSSDQLLEDSNIDDQLCQKEEKESNISKFCAVDKLSSSSDNNFEQDPTQNSDKSALDVIEEIEKSAPSQNFLLDTAVNAVIYERGLQF